MAHYVRKTPKLLGVPLQSRRMIHSEGPLEEEDLHDFGYYPAYEYLPIQSHQVRILTLCGGSPREPLLCRLQVLDYSKIEENWNTYDALSYSWGKEEAVHAILIEEETELVRSFPVRPNLYRALRRLRERPGRNIGLWIDAICIDQTSNEEKTHQLCKMLMIYHSGGNTCIWLGEGNTEDTESERGIKFVEDIVSIRSLKHLLKDEDRIADWLAFAQLLTRGWFSRRWIIQEVAASRFATIRFGGIEIKWGDLVDAIEIFYRRFADIEKLCVGDPDAFEELQRFYRISLPAKALVETTINVFRHWEGAELQSRWTLERLVMKLNRFLVTDPRDTIYAILGIANDNVRNPGANIGTDEQILVGDYSKKPLETYIDFVRYAVSKSGSLDIIVRHWASPLANWLSDDVSGYVAEAERTLPSWIGVMDSLRLESTFVDEPGKSLYRASLDIVAECSFGSTNNIYDGTLNAKGIILGVINETSEMISGLEDLLQTLDKLNYSIHSRNFVAGVLWRTLVGDRGSDGGNPPRWYGRACLYWLTNPFSKLELVVAYKRRVEEVVSNRKLFSYYAGADGSSQLGGVGPRYTQPGDLVCILFGCSVPVILRKYDNNSMEYVLIGESYVHCKMEGEHFFGQDQESVKAQSPTFTIR